jgi:hypothetical protein
MTIITYDVTPTHRYFMRRTKRDIIDKIEQMTGVRKTNAEIDNLMTLSKDQLASLAMQTFRSLPDDR